MASYYNINRSIETYELRLIDPADGQLKSVFDIPSIGGGQVDAYTKLESDALLNGKLDITNPQSITGNLVMSGDLTAPNGVKTTKVANVNNLIPATFSHMGVDYMKYEDITLDPTFHGLKILDTLYTQDIIPTQIKMIYYIIIKYHFKMKQQQIFMIIII